MLRSISKGMKVAASMMVAGSVAPLMAETPNHPTSHIVIMDASVNTLPYLPALKAKYAEELKTGGVVVGRYVARCRQGGMTKRLIDNPGETQALLDAGFGIAIISQYFSQSEKYESNPRRPEQDKEHPSDWTKPCAPVADDAVSNTMTREGVLDGRAAAEQAHILGMPAKGAVYVGIDYDANLAGKAHEKVATNILDYFTAFKAELAKYDYRLGAYGNGAAINLLRRDANNPIIDLAWLNASPAHEGSVGVYNNNAWDMLQTRTETWVRLDPKDLPKDFPAKLPKDLSVDADIVNPDRKIQDLGFWGKGEPINVSYPALKERAAPIRGNTLFACEAVAYLTETPDEKGKAIDPEICRPRNGLGQSQKCERVQDSRASVCFGSAVYVVEKDTKGQFAHVDCNWDGKPDGWMPLRMLFSKRPDYELFKAHRSADVPTHCSSSGLFPKGVQ